MSEHIDRLTLEAYAEEALPMAQRQTVGAHLAGCPVCQARLASAQQVSALLYRLPRERPAPDLAARINAAIAARRAPAAAGWMRALVPAAFAVGLALLVLAAPQWMGWVQAAATVELPTEQAMLTWLGNLVNDPASVLDQLMSITEQMLTSPAEEMSALFTLATVLLASASVAGLGQLLSSERPKVAAA